MANPYGAFTQSQKEDLRRRVRSGESRRDLAAEFGVHLNTVKNATKGIVRGKKIPPQPSTLNGG